MATADAAGVIPPTGVSTGNSWQDTLQNAFAFTLTKAVDAQFVSTPTVNADPTNWPAYNQQGQAYNRGIPSAPTSAPGGILPTNSTPLLIGAGVLAVVLVLMVASRRG